MPAKKTAKKAARKKAPKASKTPKTGRKTSRRRQVEPESRGLPAAQVADAEPPAEVAALEARVEQAGGRVLARYRDPLGGAWLALAALPLSSIVPTPFQRDLSDAHVKRLQDVIDRLGTFLDPVIAVPAPSSAEGEGKAAQPLRSETKPSEGGPPQNVQFWSPNGYHRLSALQRLGARTVTALISPNEALAYRILALNTEKAHGTKERALEAVRMARGLAELDPSRKESEFALELEDGSLVTLGFAYEARARFAGGAYAAALKASDHFLERPLDEALATRRARAERLLAIDDRVAEIMQGLKQRGFESPYLRNFVVARIRPFRPRGKPAPGADELLDHMEKAAAKFDPGKIRSEQIAKTAGGSD